MNFTGLLYPLDNFLHTMSSIAIGRAAVNAPSDQHD